MLARNLENSEGFLHLVGYTITLTEPLVTQCPTHSISPQLNSTRHTWNDFSVPRNSDSGSRSKCGLNKCHYGRFPPDLAHFLSDALYSSSDDFRCFDAYVPIATQNWHLHPRGIVSQPVGIVDPSDNVLTVLGLLSPPDLQTVIDSVICNQPF